MDKLKKEQSNEPGSFEHFLDEMAAALGVPREELDKVVAPFQQPMEREKTNAATAKRRRASSRVLAG